MDTLRVVVDEIRTTIKQTFDDKDVSRAQVAYWVIITANQLLAQHENKRSSGRFLVPFAGIPVETVGENAPYFIRGRKFVRLPGQIFDKDMDRGIDYMAFYNPDENCLPELRRKTISRTTPSQLQWLELKKDTKPSPETPYFYLTGNIAYIVGIESVPINEVEMGLFLTIDPMQDIDIDKEFFFPAELLKTLKMQVVDLARYSFLFKKDVENDGADSASTPQGSQPIPKIVSVNQNNAE